MNEYINQTMKCNTTDKRDIFQYPSFNFRIQNLLHSYQKILPNEMLEKKLFEIFSNIIKIIISRNEILKKEHIEILIKSNRILLNVKFYKKMKDY